MGLTPCPSCQRHIRDDERCPFCQAPRAGVIAATVLAVGAAACGSKAKPAAPPANPAPADAGVTAPTADAPAAATPTPPPDDGHHVRPLYGVTRP